MQRQLLACLDEKSSTLPPVHFSGIATCRFDADKARERQKFCQQMCKCFIYLTKGICTQSVIELFLRVASAGTETII